MKGRMLPLYDIGSKDLKKMFNVSDKRSIVNRLKELGVEIRMGRYVLTDDLIAALKNDNSNHTYEFKSDPKFKI